MGERYSVALLKELPDLNPVRCSINISPLRGFSDRLLQPGDRACEENRKPFKRFPVLALRSSPGLKPGVNETEPITENSTAFGVRATFVQSQFA